MDSGWLVSRRKSRHGAHQLPGRGSGRGDEIVSWGAALLLAIALVVGGATAYVLAAR